jgi:hypothetical protein
MFARPGRCVSQIGPGPNIFNSGELHVEPVPGCQLLAGREFAASRKAGRGRTR